MIVTFELDRLEPPSGGSVVSVGVFDGVHLGHRAILASNVERARELGAVPTVLTFRRHPKQVLLGRSPRTLTTLEHRLELFDRAGIEHAVALRFDEDLRRLPAEEFVDRFAVRRLGVRRFVLGFDSKFGHGRRGTPELLQALGFPVDVVDKVIVDGRAVSSTAIREAVELGDLDGAARMLGRRVSVFGRVVEGRRLGRELGFPTANLDLHHELHPPPGVYACWAHHLVSRAGVTERTTLGGVANIGFRPTVGGKRPEAPLVEVHLLDFAGDLYGERIELEFVARLRGEVRFPDLDGLVAQIRRDVEQGRERLRAEEGPRAAAPGRGEAG